MPIPADPATSDRIRTTLEHALGVPFSPGNTVDRLQNGVEIFPAMLDAIDRAESSVDFETFVYWSGEIADRFADALITAADRGVRVRIILDAVGAHPMRAELKRRLEQSAVSLCHFRPPNPLRFWKSTHRSHRKILVCDREVAFTGGVGIAEEWEGDARAPGEWRESHFSVRGPAVPLFRGVFLQHWIEAADPDDPADVVDELETGLPEVALWSGDESPGTASPSPSAGIPVQVLASLGLGEITTAKRLARALITTAQARLRITTPYFVPDPELVGLLCEARRRGVEVEILTPGLDQVDQRMSSLAGEPIWQTLLEAGITLYQYEATMLHAKVITLDHTLSCVGSVNFNHRSFRKDDEIALTVLDPVLTAQLDRDFENDLLESVRVDDPKVWPKRGAFRKAAARFSRMFRHEL